MSIVIIGGNECMERAYARTCGEYGCDAKIFTRRHKDLQHVFGCPDLCILFTSTVSHNMVRIASQEARKRRVPLARSHTSSLSALNALLSEFCAGRDRAGSARP